MQPQRASVGRLPLGIGVGNAGQATAAVREGIVDVLDVASTIPRVARDQQQHCVAVQAATHSGITAFPPVFSQKKWPFSPLPSQNFRLWRALLTPPRLLGGAARPESATLTVTIIHAWSSMVVDVQGRLRRCCSRRRCPRRRPRSSRQSSSRHGSKWTTSARRSERQLETTETLCARRVTKNRPPTRTGATHWRPSTPRGAPQRLAFGARHARTSCRGSTTTRGRCAQSAHAAWAASRGASASARGRPQAAGRYRR